MRNFGLQKDAVKFCPQCGGNTWHIYGICEHSDTHARSLAASSGIMLVIAAVLVMAMVLILAATAASYAAPGCMTKSEARAKWPTRHIWWHGGDRCWDDNPGRGSRKARWLPKPSQDANGNIAHLGGAPLAVIQVRAEEYNELDAQAEHTPAIVYPPLITGPGTTRDMLRNDELTHFPIMFDLDDVPRFEPWAARVAGSF